MIPPSDLQMAAHGQMRSNIESLVEELTSPSSDTSISPSIAAQQTITCITEYLEQVRTHRSGATARFTIDGELFDDDDTPCVQEFFWQLWTSVLETALSKPRASQSIDERMVPIMLYISKLKETPQPEGQEWFISGQKIECRELPVLGWCVRDLFNAPSETLITNPSLMQSFKNEKAMAGANLESMESLSGPAADLAMDRHRWLALQEFSSRLWRDAKCEHYAINAIWVVREGIEDWPAAPPSFDVTPSSYEDWPAYCAFLVEAATIWFRNTAPLMYANTQVWGKNGNPNWPDNAGTPGRGGKRWEGIDGYDLEHKRWDTWKQVLKEIVQWCDIESKKGNMKGWRVREKVNAALEAMAAAESG
ncbi:hypothetical protein BDV93DRAFT_608255 [Ceratobasidium sp. AG-I]|nr:hypothetical protein BDV93DRAFT_608255 [Ceratobasidium sp. AG-I]